MGWTTQAQNYLTSGAAPHYELAVVISPYNLTTEQTETFTYWSSHHDHTLTIGGVSRTLLPTFGALQASNPVYQKGTNIRVMQLQMFGLGPDAQALLQGYRLKMASAEVYHLLFSQGMEFQGEKRLWKGTVDTADLSIGAKGEGSKLDLTIASAMRKGTISRAEYKSNASYAKRLVDVGNGPEPDTSMIYASLQDAESDPWGPPQ